jgi:hypothetical protein
VPVAAYRKKIIKAVESLARSFGQSNKEKEVREAADDSN